MFFCLYSIDLLNLSYTNYRLLQPSSLTNVKQTFVKSSSLQNIVFLLILTG